MSYGKTNDESARKLARDKTVKGNYLVGTKLATTRLGAVQTVRAISCTPHLESRFGYVTLCHVINIEFITRSFLTFIIE